MKLKDKGCIVTGASSGIGREIARMFAAEGAKVIAVGRRKERLEDLSREFGNITSYVADMVDQAEVEEMVRFAVKEFGKVDVLVNSAGMLDDFTPIEDTTDDLWDTVMKVNLYAPMWATREALKGMLATDGGVIINVASIGGLFGARGGAAYSASKHGLIGLTKNVGFMYAQKNIRCNAICPGGVETEINKNIDQANPFGKERALVGIRANPRMGSSDEIASIAVFLASDHARYINGATITADGGWTAY